MTDHDTVRIGLLGCGIVGSAAARMLVEHEEELRRRCPFPLRVTRAAVRTTSKDRDVPPGIAFTTDPHEVVKADDVDVVVEVMGGIEPARTLILEAFALGKPVVSANKELISTLGSELFAAARAAGVDFLFEAAVAGGVPLIRPLRESLAGERIRRVLGIVNGTTNFILTRMTEDGSTFSAALAEAQQLGYAERDPTADVEGYDAAAKAAILATLAFNTRVVQGDVYREGITAITAEDIAQAAAMGYVVKLLAIADDDGDAVSVRVHPTMLPLGHPLAAVRDSFNAVFVEGDKVGQLMFYGRGAGGGPTGTSVVGDIVDAARNRAGGHSVAWPVAAERPIRPIDDMTAQYYVDLHVADRPGVLARVADTFGAHGVSIASVNQKGSGDEARLVMVTHRAVERAMQATLHDLRLLEPVRAVGSLLRVEDEAP